MKTYKKLDIHAHIFPEKIREKAVAAIGTFYDFEMQRKGSAADLLTYREKAGINCFVVHSVATVPKQVCSINDFLKEQLDAHPEFIGFATLHPDMEGLADEIDRVISLGFRGIKLHPDFQQFDIDSPSAQNLYTLVDGRLPILLHMGDKVKTFSQPKRLAKMAVMFPKQVFIGAHLGGYNAWDESEEYLIGKSNIYIDTSSALFALDPAHATEIMRRHGVEKAIFGTDYPMWDPEEELERFAKLQLTDEERRMIFFENAAKLFGISEE